MSRGKNISTVEISKTKKPGFKFVASCYDPDGRRSRFFFRTRQEADALRTLKLAEFTQASTHIELSEEERLAVRQARKHGLDLGECVRIALTLKQKGKSSVRAKELLDLWLEQLKSAGRSVRYRTTVENFLARVVEEWGNPLIADVGKDLIGLSIHGKPDLSASTKASYRRLLSGLFSFAITQGIVEDNPVKRVMAPKVNSHADEVVGILTPEQGRAMLAAAAGEAPELLPVVAIGLFAGLRTAELQRLEWNDVLLEKGLVVVSAGKAKTNNRRMVTIQPPLEAILRAMPRPTLRRIWPPNGMKLWDRTLKAAGWRGHKLWAPAPNPNAPLWPANAMRHSFVSYHVAMFKDAALTALESGHSPEVLFKHYRQLVTEDDAEEYWSVRLEGS